MVVVQPILGMLFPNSEHIKRKITEAGLKNAPVAVVVDFTHVAVVDYTSGVVS